MIISLANLIVDHDAAAVAMRTQDTMRYVQAEWNKSHEEPIDTAELHKFLCDEHYGDLTEEQSRSSVYAVTKYEMPTPQWCAACCCVKKCCAGIWLQISRPTAAYSARMAGMHRGL